MKIVKRVLVVIILALLAAAATLYWLGTRDHVPAGPQAAPATGSADELVEQGRYLARAGNCMACHTARGGQAYAGGTPIPTPFGTLYGPNITPDAETGIGGWSADDFWQALHNGKGPDGRLLYPAFPYTEYTRMTRADADALYAFLRTVEPVRQPSRPHALESPYDQRLLLAAWRALYFEPGGPQPDPGQSLQWNRGRYLTEGLGHCAACHTPRNSLGATRAAEALGGGMIDGLGWYAPPLTGQPGTGLGDWSAQDIAALLTTGIAPHSTVAGPMAEVVLGSTQYLSDDDALAIGAYLKSLPAAAQPPARRGAPSATVMELGGKMYSKSCAQCHQADGKGSFPAWPALAGNPSVIAAEPANVIRMVLDGGFAPATATNPRPHGMPPFAQALPDNDIAMLVSYVRNSWGNQAGAVTPLDVKRTRESGAGR